jgi:hypothetical protein
MAPLPNSSHTRRSPKPIAVQEILYVPPSKVILIVSLNLSVSSTKAVTCHIKYGIDGLKPAAI